jgi:tricorn protease-like protein
VAEDSGSERGQTLTRFVLKTKKSEKLADHIAGFDLSFDGEKMLLEMGTKNPKARRLGRVQFQHL